MSGLWDALNHSVRTLIDIDPLMVLAAVLFFEEAGVPSPIPSDIMMLLAGVRARQGDYPFWAVILVQELATLAGTTCLFLFSRRFGGALVARYGWVLHLGPETLARAEAAIATSGGRAIVIGRLIPGLRIITPVAAAVLGTPLRTFLPAVALGAFLYILGFTLVGALVGPTALAILERVALPTGALVSLAVVFVAIFLVSPGSSTNIIHVKAIPGGRCVRAGGRKARPYKFIRLQPLPALPCPAQQLWLLTRGKTA